MKVQKEKDIRIQFELNEARYEELTTLMGEVNVRTKKELINNALSLLEWVVKEVKSGKTIASVDEQKGKYKEICMPILSAVQVKASKKQKAAA